MISDSMASSTETQKKAPERSKWIVWGFFACVIGFLFFTQKTVIVSGDTMGTTFYIRCRIPRVVPLFVLEYGVEKKLHALTTIFSTYTESSELMDVNRWKTSSPLVISDSLKTVFRQSFLLYELSQGDWDPTVYPLMKAWGLYSQFGSIVNPPSAIVLDEAKKSVGFNSIHIVDNTLTKDNPDTYIDFSSIAKGYAVDEITSLLSLYFRSSSFLVEIGGEVRTRGKKEDGALYKVGINRPLLEADPSDIIMRVIIEDKAIATSGNYRRYRLSNGRLVTHIINPKTGDPIESSIVSVSVIAPSCSMADGLATAIMVMGEERGLQLIESLIDTEVCIITQEDDSFSFHKSSGFSQFEAH